jgi:hypothetical protein
MLAGQRRLLPFAYSQAACLLADKQEPTHGQEGTAIRRRQKSQHFAMALTPLVQSCWAAEHCGGPKLDLVAKMHSHNLRGHLMCTRFP